MSTLAPPMFPNLGAYADVANAISPVIKTAVLMTLRAMSLCCLDGCPCQRRAKCIHTWSDSLKVFGVHTISDTAEMIDLLAFWNWPYKKLISKAVNKPCFVTEPNEAVAGATLVSLPLPTTVGRNNNKAHQALLGSHWLRATCACARLRLHLEALLSGVMRTDVSASRPLNFTPLEVSS